ncbi:acyltransferase [Clostridium sp. AM58-1XD]|uniref:acyltransferase family protein n=1 Tax=Clostridium sp. AM58-1XD TaxID=2292307 RepID=UPI000E536038|nr:acyltransferase [Clostridium sp. AM58-1XD]RGY96742.1 acyltransferase [Clostridium sp. AM58-1XD]
MENRKRRTIISYNALRGVCALGIFCHHNSYLADAGSLFWQQLYNCFLKYGSRCTSFFFIMSGFLLAYTWRDMPFKDYIRGKLKRLYPLALFVFILAVGCSFILNDEVNGSMVIGSPIWLGSIILNLLLLKAFVPIEEVFYSFHGPSWYISVLFAFYVIGYFVVGKIKRAQLNDKYANKRSSEYRHILRGLRRAILLIYLIQLTICMIVDVKGILEYRLYLTYVNPYFRILGEGMLGVLLCESMPEIQKRISTWNKSVLETVAFIVLTVWFPINYFISSSVWSAWIWSIPFVLVMIAFNSDMGIISKCMKGRGWQFLGDISFELYMTHAFVYEGLPVIAGIVSKSLKNWLIYHTGTRFLSTLLLSIVFAWCVNAGIRVIMRNKFSKKCLSC